MGVPEPALDHRHVHAGSNKMDCRRVAKCVRRDMLLVKVRMQLLGRGYILTEPKPNAGSMKRLAAVVGEDRLVRATWLDDITYAGDDGRSTFRRQEPRSEIIPVALEIF